MSATPISKEIFRASHVSCIPAPYFYIPRLMKREVCFNCGETIPDYVQFQLKLLND